MVDSASAIPPVPPATVPAAPSTADRINNAAYLSALVQSVEANNLLTLENAVDTTQVSTQNNATLNEGLLSLDPQTLALLNNVGSDPQSTSITGNLTAQQLQEIGILLKDEAGLEAAANLTSALPLTSNATTVDLSLAAQNIAFGTGTATSPVTGTVLTPAQLTQIGVILAPLANAPLTPAVLVDIQAQLTAAGFSPTQLSLSTIALVMNYLAVLQPPAAHITEETKVTTAQNKDEETVAPVEATDKVAAESSAILAE